MEGEDGDSSDEDNHAKKHDGDEPGGSIGCFWRGLGDSKGVNEDVREIEEGLHGFLRKAASSVPGPHLLVKYAFSWNAVLAAVVAGDYTK